MKVLVTPCSISPLQWAQKQRLKKGLIKDRHFRISVKRLFEDNEAKKQSTPHAPYLILIIAVLPTYIEYNCVIDKSHKKGQIIIGH